MIPTGESSRGRAKGPERGRPGVRAALLVGELDWNGLLGALALNFRRSCLVSVAWARRLIGLIHKNNPSTNGGASPTGWLRVRGRD